MSDVDKEWSQPFIELLRTVSFMCNQVQSKSDILQQRLTANLSIDNRKKVILDIKKLLERTSLNLINFNKTYNENVQVFKQLHNVEVGKEKEEEDKNAPNQKATNVEPIQNKSDNISGEEFDNVGAKVSPDTTTKKETEKARKTVSSPNNEKRKFKINYSRTDLPRTKTLNNNSINNKNNQSKPKILTNHVIKPIENSNSNTQNLRQISNNETTQIKNKRLRLSLKRRKSELEEEDTEPDLASSVVSPRKNHKTIEKNDCDKSKNLELSDSSSTTDEGDLSVKKEETSIDVADDDNNSSTPTIVENSDLSEEESIGGVGKSSNLTRSKKWTIYSSQEECEEENQIEIINFDANVQSGGENEIVSQNLMDSEAVVIEKNFTTLKGYEEADTAPSELLHLLNTDSLNISQFPDDSFLSEKKDKDTISSQEIGQEMMILNNTEYNFDNDLEEAFRRLEETEIAEVSDCSVDISTLDFSSHGETSDHDDDDDDDNNALSKTKKILTEDQIIDRLCNLKYLETKKISKKTNEKKSNNRESNDSTEDIVSTSSDDDDDNDDDDEGSLTAGTQQSLNFMSLIKPNDDEQLADAILNGINHDSHSDSDKESTIHRVLKKRKRVLSSSDETTDEVEQKKSKKRRSWRNDPLLRDDLSISSSFRAVKEKEQERKKTADNLEKDTENVVNNVSDDTTDKRSVKSGNIFSWKSEILSDSNSIPASDDEIVINSDSDDSDIEIISVAPSRRNIRRILTDSELTHDTQIANAEEVERIERLEEIKKTKVSIGKDVEGLVLDVDPETKKPSIIVDRGLCAILKKHQLEGITFMWESCYESVASIKKGDSGSGCILAHCMGLGKTLQVISLVNTLFHYNTLTATEHVLVVCPLSTVLNWKNEFDKAFEMLQEPGNYSVHYCLQEELRDKCGIVKRWKKRKGVLLISYGSFVNLMNSKRLSPELSKEMIEALIDPGPQLIVCDEAHLLKNGKTSRTQALISVKTKRRIALTGTPLQNNLTEYYHMVKFVKPNLLGTFGEYTNRFVTPIINGHFHDSTKEDVKLMKKRTHVLNKLLKRTIHRREASILKSYLPELFDYILFIRLSSKQKELYKKYLDLVKSQGVDKKTFFKDYRILRNICFHPYNLTLQKTDTKNKKKTANEAEDSDTEAINSIPIHWWSSLNSSDFAENLKFGTKVEVIMHILDEAEKIGDKVLIFSESLAELDCIEHFLKIVGTPNRRYWQKNKHYFRMDGKVSAKIRENLCKKFNNDNIDVKAFLISHKVGGLGLNLIAANRVILASSNFNPSVDTQSIYRSYRFGQKKKCYIYRLVSMGTMEEKVYQRCLVKLSVAGTVIDSHHLDRLIARNDFQKTMYNCDFKDDCEERPVPKIPTDKLFAEILNLNHNIYKYSDHQSLLENRPEEELDEEEKRLAWVEYHNERLAKTNVPPVMPPPNQSLPSTSSNKIKGLVAPSLPVEEALSMSNIARFALKRNGLNWTSAYTPQEMIMMNNKNRPKILKTAKTNNTISSSLSNTITDDQNQINSFLQHYLWPTSNVLGNGTYMVNQRPTTNNSNIQRNAINLVNHQPAISSLNTQGNRAYVANQRPSTSSSNAEKNDTSIANHSSTTSSSNIRGNGTYVINQHLNRSNSNVQRKGTNQVNQRPNGTHVSSQRPTTNNSNSQGNVINLTDQQPTISSLNIQGNGAYVANQRPSTSNPNVQREGTNRVYQRPTTSNSNIHGNGTHVANQRANTTSSNVQKNGTNIVNQRPTTNSSNIPEYRTNVANQYSNISSSNIQRTGTSIANHSSTTSSSNIQKASTSQLMGSTITPEYRNIQPSNNTNQQNISNNLPSDYAAKLLQKYYDTVRNQYLNIHSNNQSGNNARTNNPETFRTNVPHTSMINNLNLNAAQMNNNNSLVNQTSNKSNVIDLSDQ